MSAYATIKITRLAAIQAIVGRLHNLSDEELVSLTNNLILQEKLLECEIVEEQEQNDNIVLFF